MVSKKIIKSLGFKNLNEYFGYIIDSITNGQIKQSKDLYYNLSKIQRENFYTFLKENNIDLYNTLKSLNDLYWTYKTNSMYKKQDS